MLSSMVWEITLFGPLMACRGDRHLSHFRTRKTASLLAYLAFYHQRPHRREEIMECLWPDHEPEAARNLLRVTLTHLRQALDACGDSSLLVCDRNHARLHTEAFMTDCRAFDALLDQASHAQEEEQKLTLLRQAASLYHGEMLPGMDEGWIAGERQRRNDVYLIALRQIIKTLAARKAYDPALDYAQRALCADPFREESHRTLMRLYVMVGRAEAARRQYDDLARQLNEIGSRPSTLTENLLAEILAVERTTRTPVSSSRAVAASPPPTTPLFNVPSALLSPLFGRDGDLAQLQQMLDTPETRLITLTGLGGAGKTRLALALAHQTRAVFQEAVFFVSLAALSDGTAVADAILAALPVERAAMRPALEQIAAYFAAQRGLLILDNCEHVLAEGVSTLHALLEAAPDLICLATSRERLNLRYEYEYPVRLLTTPPVASSLQSLADCASVQMFVERAGKAQPGFALEPENMEAVAALCGWLEGLPLAIELAAAWTRALAPAQILTRLKSRMTLLASAQHDIPARHASLRAALEGSYQILPLPLQKFLARLSIFQGGLTLEAGEVALEEPQALTFLAQLAERSLLVTETAPRGMRYRLLETVRQYAEEKLQENEGEEGIEALAWQHARFYCAWAQAQQEALMSDKAAQALGDIDREYANARAALDWCARANKSGANDIGLGLASALWRYWDARGYAREGLDWFRALLDGSGEDRTIRSRSLSAAGNLAYRSGRPELARGYYEEGLQLCRALGDTRREAGMLANLGNLARGEGRVESAREAYEKALTIFRALGDARSAALSLANLGNAARDAGQYAEAMRYNQEALLLFRQAQDRFSLGLTFNNISHIQLKMGQCLEAAPMLLKALAIAEELGDRSMLCYSAFLCALRAIGRAEWERGALLLSAADALREQSQKAISPQAARERAEAVQAVLTHSGAAAFEEQWERGRNLEPGDILRRLYEEAASGPSSEAVSETASETAEASLLTI